MPEFGPSSPEAQSSLQVLAGFAMAWLVVKILVAIAAAVWIFNDAEARGKNGIAAALIALLSVFYGIPATIIVVCVWTLFRPDKIRRGEMGTGKPLPAELPSGIVGAPSSEEFLGGLKEDS